VSGDNTAMQTAADERPVPTSAAAPASDVVLIGVDAGYGETVALLDVSLDVAAGSLVAVVGPNGAGKSTLLKLVAGLLKPWRGEVIVLGAPPGTHARQVAYVPQAELVDWTFPITVDQVVMMGRYPLLGPLRRPGAEDVATALHALERVGMQDLRHRQIGALSGGQRRRVFLARALATPAQVFLLDEPVTAIDPATQDDIMDLLAIEAAAGRTVIATTHDLACAAECFKRVVAVNRTVVADGPSSIALDAAVLARAYGGHLLRLEGDRVLIDDAHHHDEAVERHFHDDGRER
jgi:ABC-type Mn2+/Zn2+ transport system ATPase subunit